MIGTPAMMLMKLLVQKASLKDETAYQRGQIAGIQSAIWILMAQMSAQEIADAEAFAKQEVSRA